jgi:hypothetical protein
MNEAICVGKPQQKIAGGPTRFRMVGLRLHPFTMVPSSNGVKNATTYLTVRLGASLDCCHLRAGLSLTNSGREQPDGGGHRFNL